MRTYDINGFEIAVSRLGSGRYVASAAGINYYFYEESVYDALIDEEEPESDEQRARIARILADEISERVYNA